MTTTELPVEGPADGVRPGLLARIAPGLSLLAHYKGEWLRGDLVAGVLLAAYLMPAGIADASLASLPPQAGLYACLFSGLVFWLFCSSRHTAVTTTSAISLLVGASLGEMAGGDASRFAAMAIWTAILAGALSLLTWIVRAGVVINFVSETVLLGFKAGIALVLISTQLPKLLGFSGAHGGTFGHRVAEIVRHLGDTNQTSLLLGGAALAVLLLGKVFLKKIPMALVVVVAGIVLGSVMDLAAHGVKTLGAVPQGLPSLSVPRITNAEFNQLLPLALACFLLGAVETAAIGRMFALKHGYRYEPNQEFLALAGANLAAGFGQGFPVSGGMSQSLVNESGGARTPLSGLVGALLMLAVVLFMSGLLSALPQPVLAAIVISAVTGLVKVAALKRVWRFSRLEFTVAMVALVGVLESGILRGVLIGAILSIFLLLRRASKPHTAELGRVPGTDYFADRVRHPENEREPGVFVFRTESALLYFNSDYVRDEFMKSLAGAGPGVRLAVLHLGTVALADMAGAELLVELHHSLKARGIDFRLAEAHGRLRERLRRIGYDKECGTVEANQTVTDVVSQWKREQRPA